MIGLLVELKNSRTRLILIRSFLYSNTLKNSPIQAYHQGDQMSFHFLQTVCGTVGCPHLNDQRPIKLLEYQLCPLVSPVNNTPRGL